MTILVLAIAAGAAIVLVVPVHVDIDVELDILAEPSTQSVHVRAHWLFFAWRSGQARRARPAPTPRRRSGARSAGSLRPRRVLAALRTRGFIGRLARLAVELWRALAPRTVDGWVRFGVEDPVSTGVLFGAAHAVVALAQVTAWHVRLEPEFAGPALAGHARLVWAVRPGAVLWPVGTFVASPITWRAAWAALRAT
jgi:hypothetical protein